MLTATFSMVALMVEQKTAQRNLAVLQQQLLSCATLVSFEDGACLQTFLKQFLHFDEFFRARNIESFVIPEIRKKTKEAGALLSELDALSTRSTEIVETIRNQMAKITEVKDLCGSLQEYCHAISQRLAKEEELLAMSQRIISKEAWFEMATLFISQDAKLHTQETSYRPAQFH
jgi:hypothetical protein